MSSGDGIALTLSLTVGVVGLTLRGGPLIRSKKKIPKICYGDCSLIRSNTVRTVVHHLHLANLAIHAFQLLQAKTEVGQILYHECSLIIYHVLSAVQLAVLLGIARPRPAMSPAALCEGVPTSTVQLQVSSGLEAASC